MDFSYPNLDNGFIVTPSPSKSPVLDKQTSEVTKVIYPQEDLTGLSDGIAKLSFREGSASVPDGTKDSNSINSSIANIGTRKILQPVDSNATNRIGGRGDPGKENTTVPKEAPPVRPSVNRTLKPSINSNTIPMNNNYNKDIARYESYSNNKNTTKNYISTSIDNSSSRSEGSNSSNQRQVPVIPSRSLKPRDLLKDHGREIEHEKQMMEQAMRHEQQTLSDLSKLETEENEGGSDGSDEKSAASIERLQEKIASLQAASSNMEDNLNRVMQENRKLWEVVSASLASSNKSNVDEGAIAQDIAANATGDGGTVKVVQTQDQVGIWGSSFFHYRYTCQCSS